MNYLNDYFKTSRNISFGFVLLFFFSINNINAQVKGGQHDKLFDLFLMENYEGCLSKAEKMASKDKNRKDAEPLLYISMCMYQISLNPEMTELDEYKNAYKDALKYASKAIKKDKDGEICPQNSDYFAELKARGKEEAQYFYNEDNFSKASSAFKAILKIDEEDEGFMMMTGVTYLKARNIGEGSKMVDEAIELIKTKYANPNYQTEEVTYETMIYAIIAYTDFLKESGEVEKTKDVISAMRSLLNKDDEIKMQYETLMR